MDIIILIFSLFLLYKKKLAWVLFSLLLLTTSYFNVGTNLSEFPFTHNVSDSGLVLYLFLSFYLLKKNKFKVPKITLNKYIKFFFLFLLVSIIIDLVFNGIDLLSVVKTSRHWIFLTCIWIFAYISEEDVKIIIKYLLNALAIAALITIIDYFFNVQLLGKEVKTEYLSPGFLIERAAIPSVLILFFILLLFSKYFNFKPKIKYFYLGIFSTVLITSMIRSLFLATMIGIILLFYLQEKLKLKNLFAGIALSVGLILLVTTNPIIQERFSQGFEDIQSFSPTSNIQGNFSFRIFQALQRLDYISQSYQYQIFGVGNITEKNFPYVFTIGLKDESGLITQIDTADIAWSLLFLRLGLLGTLIYMVYYINILIKFYKFRLNSPLAITMFVYLFITITIISFASSDIASGQFWLLPILVYYQIKKSPENDI